MQSQEDLQALELYQLYEKMEPLVAPAPVSKMPVGPGWWILLAVALLALLTIVGLTFYRRYQNRHRYYAIAEIEALPENYHAWEVSAILKRCALSQFSRQQVAALTGRPWCEFLNKHYPKGPGFTDFNQLQCQADDSPGGFDRAQLKRQAIDWLSGYKVTP